MARRVPQIRAKARANDGEVDQERLVFASGVAAKECPPSQLFDVHS